MMLNEPARLHALQDYRVLDTAPEEVFENVTQLVTMIMDAPIALVTLVDEHRQWFKSKVGLDVPETPREIAFCDHAIRQDDPLIVPDAACDPRFENNPLVTRDPNIRFYCGVPLHTAEGLALGTLCVIDRKPRTISAEQVSALRLLARQVEIELEIRRRLLILESALQAQESERRAKELLASMIVHDLRSPLTAIVLLGSVLSVNTEESREALADLLGEAERARRMLTDILDVCLQDLGQLHLRRSRFLVQDRMHLIQQRMARFARQREQHIVLALPPAPVWLDGDVEIFERICTNLIANAMQHGPAKQQITVRIEQTRSDTVRCEVRDQNATIPEHERAQLFSAFEHPEVARSGTRTRGHGLGLAFCQLAVEAHGGTIGVESPGERGNTFHFELPVR